jgi:hypothetical protein
MQRRLLAVVVALLLAGGGWVAGQQTQVQPFGPRAVPPDIRTGADIGFRVHSIKDGRVMGTLVVRTKDGAWFEAHPVPTQGFVVPLDTK